ncbi:MAG TPA: GxxExxY protein [bacterium]|nr:GxxExxY protein [bacterium]HPJ71251.1 GxxExxY protein [bacterium]
MEYLYSETTEKIIQAAYRVHKTLGFGFLEKVYENALAVELGNTGMMVEQQKPLAVYYEGNIVGDFVIDMLVDGKIVVEIKAVKKLIDVHEIQLLNYLKGCRLEVGLLINFGTSVQTKRKYLHH